MKKSSERFTLIELLVVIAVIMILMSMLLPAIGSARETGRKIFCAANMRSIHQACQMYVNDYNGWMPPTNWNGGYAYYVNFYMPLKNVVTVDGAVGGVWFPKPNNLVCCPSMSEPPGNSPCADSTLKGKSAAYYYPGYQVTWYHNTNDESLGCWIHYDTANPGAAPFRRMDKIKDGCAILTDKNWGMIQGITYQSVVSYYYAYLYTDNTAPGWNHNLVANFVFKDGHVGAYKYTGAKLFDNDYIPR